MIYARLTDQHLRDVDGRTLGAGNDHLFNVIVLLQIRLRVLTGMITGQVQLALNGFRRTGRSSFLARPSDDRYGRPR